jgi:hypothetical protein
VTVKRRRSTRRWRPTYDVYLKRENAEARARKVRARTPIVRIKRAMSNLGRGWMVWYYE